VSHPDHPTLAGVDLTQRLSKSDETRFLRAQQQRFLRLRLAGAGLIGEAIGPPLAVVFEGWDASGKGGAIRRLTAPLDPRHVHVTQFAAPTPEEKRRHFMARFVPALPGWGGMAVLDRSWYGRVLVERVEGFCTEVEWRRAYDEIVQFETAMVAEGMVLVKFWLHMSSDEQLRRFEARRDHPLKRWKLTDDDWRNRQRRPAYDQAIDEMFARTHHPGAPWDVVAADNKPFARVEVLRRVNDRYEDGLLAAGVDVPGPGGEPVA
jgi:polyphosphate kinase 2 (PPK2 family)